MADTLAALASLGLACPPEQDILSKVISQVESLQWAWLETMPCDARAQFPPLAHHEAQAKLVICSPSTPSPPSVANVGTYFTDMMSKPSKHSSAPLPLRAAFLNVLTLRPHSSKSKGLWAGL
eukprot:573050-Pyramimonas_sp.AAC.1